MTDTATVTLAFNAYCWGAQFQDALLAECILPLFKRLAAECETRRIWYDRATMRGPHIFGLVTVSTRSEAEARKSIAEALASFFEERPSLQHYTPEQLNAFHRDAGGKALCDTDLEPGMASNNSFAIIVHEDAELRYPFFLWRDAADGSFWRTSGRLTIFTLNQLARKDRAESLNSAALDFLLVFDRVFFDRLEDARAYWAYHVSTLIPNLDVNRLESSHARAMLQNTMLPESFEQLRQVWSGRQESGYGDHDGLQQILRDLRLVLGGAASVSRGTVRELLHVVLKQLGISTLHQIPMIFSLFALNCEVQEIAGRL